MYSKYDWIPLAALPGWKTQISLLVHVTFERLSTQSWAISCAVEKIEVASALMAVSAIHAQLPLDSLVSFSTSFVVCSRRVPPGSVTVRLGTVGRYWVYNSDKVGMSCRVDSSAPNVLLFMTAENRKKEGENGTGGMINKESSQISWQTVQNATLTYAYQACNVPTRIYEKVFFFFNLIFSCIRECFCFTF